MHELFRPEKWFRDLRLDNPANPFLGWNGQDQEWIATLLHQAVRFGSLDLSKIAAPTKPIWGLVKRMKHLAAAFEKARDLELLETVDPNHRAFEEQIKARIALYESPDNGLSKEAHDVQTYSNLLLDMAREFVRARLGSYADGAIQELLIQMDPSNVLDADALRKKVERFRNSYPPLHKLALSQAAVPKKPGDLSVIQASSPASSEQRQWSLSPPTWFGPARPRPRLRRLGTAPNKTA